MISYQKMLKGIGERARALRIFRELKQREVAARAGLGPATVARFERSGRATLENVLRIAMVLDAEDAFSQLFPIPRYRSLDEALASPPARQRVRGRAAR
jgi:transcriptional regulator with XRE-family HTH domain